MLVLDGRNGPPAAGYLQPDPAFVVFGTDDFDDPHHAGALQMGAAAGAEVPAGNLHQPHRAFQSLFASIGKGFQGLRVRVPGLYRQVLLNQGVGLGLRFLQLGGGKGKVNVHPHIGLTNVKAHIVGPEQPVKGAAENVLSGVLLAVVQPPLPVNDAFHGGSRFQGLGNQVLYLSLPELYIQDFHPVQSSQVTGLAASFRKKSGLVQVHPISLFGGDASGHQGGKHQGRRGILVQFSGHKIPPFFLLFKNSVYQNTGGKATAPGSQAPCLNKK